MKRLLFLLTICTLLSCQPDDKVRQHIIGKWQAYAFTESNDSVKLNPTEIAFEFDESGKYQFRSTLNYREAGYYKLENDLLYTTDTLRFEAPEEKAVRILSIVQDTIIINMNREGNEQQLSLVRIE